MTDRQERTRNGYIDINRRNRFQRCRLKLILLWTRHVLSTCSRRVIPFPISYPVVGDSPELGISDGQDWFKQSGRFFRSSEVISRCAAAYIDVLERLNGCLATRMSPRVTTRRSAPYNAISTNRYSFTYTPVNQSVTQSHDV